MTNIFWKYLPILWFHLCLSFLNTFLVQAIVRLVLLGITFLFVSIYFSSLDFHELWHSVMSIRLFIEVKLGWVTALVHYSCL